MRDKMSVK
jgi:hypothetical protein